MNALPDRPIRKFNPGILQPDEEVIRQFAVRHREFDSALEVLRANIGSSSCQHALLIAPHGYGKTMLLARIAAELHTDRVLAELLLPVRFTEESQEIFNLDDFWLEILFHLAREVAATNRELARELQAMHADWAERWREQELAERIRAAVLASAEQLDKQLVLMIENLQDLCKDVDEEFGWQLRQTLEATPQLMLLATATSRFEGLEDQFAELFSIIHLQPLDTQQCVHLWKQISGDKEIGRKIRPLEILTGGSPRLLVVIAEFARHRSMRQLMEELVTLLDHHTEYFRGHIGALAKTERRVYLAVIDLWQPSTTAEIATRARMDIRTASTMLGRLVARGAVNAKGSERKRVYVAAERLYSMYYKLRREREQAAVVQDLIHFMTAFYGDGELAASGDKEVVRAGSSTVPELQAALTLVLKGIKQGERGAYQRAIATYDRLVARFGQSDEPQVQLVVGTALVGKGAVQIETGHTEEALRTSAELARRLSTSTSSSSEGINFDWQVQWIKTKAYIRREKRLSNLGTDAFRAAYDAFDPSDATALRQLLEDIPTLIARGASERAIVAILSGDSDKASALAPLVVALRQRTGEDVRAPAEVLEVAADIGQQIEEVATR